MTRRRDPRDLCKVFTGIGGGHRYAPSYTGGFHPDGSARVWSCECGSTIRFQPWPPVTVRAR